MRLFALCAVLGAVLFPVRAQTWTDTTESRRGPVSVLTVDWVSDGDGDASGTTDLVCGQLIRAVTTPGAASPSANYDIVITDETGENVLTNCHDDLLNRHATNQEEVYFLLEVDAGAAVGAFPHVCDALTIAISNAGDTKAGSVAIYYRAY